MLVVWIAGCALAPARPPAERLAWGVVAMLAVAWSTLWQPVVGVSWLGHRALMAVIVVVCTIVVAARTRAWRTAPNVRPVVLVATVALSVSVLPLVWGPSAVAPISDMQWHEGWIRQLVGGLPEPSGVYAHVPNSYPWLYHALAAWLELLPGGMVEVYWALQVFAVGSLALGTWLLARELGLREGPATWAVGFASLAGGVGWIWVHEPVAVVSSSRYGLVHGDFLVGPAVTPALANMPAILPRDLALALFPLTVWFALRAVAGRRMRDTTAAGALAGCLLLIGPVGAVVAVLVCGPVALRRRIPVRHAAAAVAAAAFVVAPWLGRVALNYVRLGGFSPHQPLPSVTASQALVAMGVVLPIGLIGVAWMLRTRPPGIDLGALALLVAVPAVLCLLAGLLPGHSLAGVAPIVKLQRYLPFLVLALAMPAGWAADAVLARMSRRGAIVLAMALVAAAGASTVLTSIGLAGDFRSAEPRGLHCRGGAPMGAGDVVAVAGMRPQATLLVDSSVFRSTGAWLFHWVPPAQLRYRDVFSIIKGQGERAAETREIARGRVPAGIDWVVLPGAAPGRSLVKATSCRVGGLHHSVDVQVYRPRSSG
jgi:hypothetical protein